MKKMAVVVVAVLWFALTAAAQAPKKPAAKAAPAAAAAAKPEPGLAASLQTKIRQAWQDFKDGKKDAYAAVLDDKFVAVEADGKGARDKKAAVAEVDSIMLHHYELSDFRITLLGGGALATYRAKVDAMVGGQSMKADVAISEVWARRGADWKCLHYQETEVK